MKKKLLCIVLLSWSMFSIGQVTQDGFKDIPTLNQLGIEVNAAYLAFEKTQNTRSIIRTPELTDLNKVILAYENELKSQMAISKNDSELSAVIKREIDLVQSFRKTLTPTR